MGLNNTRMHTHSQNPYSYQVWLLIGRNDNHPQVIPVFLFCMFQHRYGEEMCRGKENSTINLSFIRKTEKKLLFLSNKCFAFIIFFIKFSSVSERKYQNV